jgi:DNA primase large subunit
VPVRLNNAKDCIRKFVKKWIVDKFNINVDWAVIGDTSRLCRIVYTKHEKTGNYVIPIRKYDNVERLLRRAKNLFELESIKLKHNAWVSKKLLELDNVDIKNTVFATKETNNLRMFGEEIVPECIQKIKNDIEMSGDAGHPARFHLASYYILLGYSDEEIVKMFSKAKDFNYDKSMYMVKHIKGRGYWAYSCERLKSMGLCPLGEDRICPFYPSINLLFKCNGYGGV